MMRLFRRNSKTISNPGDPSLQHSTPTDNPTSDTLEHIDNINTTNTVDTTNAMDTVDNVNIVDNMVTVSDTSDGVMDKVEELENTLVNSFSGDTAESSIELDASITNTMEHNSVENIINTNTDNSVNSFTVNTSDPDENVESSVKRRVNMKPKRKNSKHFNTSYNSPYYSQYTSPSYQHSNYNTQNYNTPNYNTTNYFSPNYSNNYTGNSYTGNNYVHGNFNKYYPTQYNNTATAVNFNHFNPNNTINTNTNNVSNVNSVLNKIQLMKNRQSSALQILNPHTGEVINSSTATTTQPTNTVAPSVTNDIPTTNIDHTIGIPDSITDNITDSVSSTVHDTIPSSIPSTIPDTIPDSVPSDNIVDIVESVVAEDTVDLAEIPEENHITAPISVDTVESVDNTVLDNRVTVDNSAMDVDNTVLDNTVALDNSLMDIDNDSSVAMSLDWQENTPTQMAPPIVLISVQSKPKTKIKNKPINPAEIILTLSELHPNPNISAHNSHSKSHSRKIHNVPAENGHPNNNTINNMDTVVNSVNVVSSVDNVEDLDDVADDTVVIVNTINTTNTVDIVDNVDSLEIPVSPFGDDASDNLFDLGKTVNGNTVDIIADPVDITITDHMSKIMVEPVKLVDQVKLVEPRALVDTVKMVDVVPSHIESKILESQGFDYSVDNLIRLSFGVFDVEIEDLGTFKIVPLNYVIRKKAKKTPQWRDISATNSINTVSSVNGVSKMSKLDQLKRAIRTLLNKLTVENFLVVSDKIVTIYREMSLREEVEVLVELLHEKGTTELEYADMYADLAFLLRYSYNDVLDLGNKTTLFHKSLLNKCQDSFEQINSNASLDKSVILGSIRFMGELFLRKILSINILKRISNTLLFSSRQNNNSSNSVNSSGSSSEENLNTTTNETVNGSTTTDTSNTDTTDHTVNTNNTVNTDNTVANESVQNVESIESEPPMNLLECFVELLTTIGYTVEQIPGGVQMLDEYTGILIQLRNSGKYPTRINFKIQDLIDLRRRNWKLKLFKEKATSVSQIHKQVEQEQLTGSTNSVEGKYITAGLQVNRHYTQFLLDKRQIAIDSLVNGVYTGSPPVPGDKSNMEEMMSIVKEFESLCCREAFEDVWKKFSPNDSEAIVLFQQMLKICMNNSDLDSGLKMADLIAFLIAKIINSDTLRAKLLNILCNNYVIRLNEEMSENEHVISYVTKILTRLFCRLPGESRNLLERISLPNDFNTAKQLCVSLVHAVREYSTVDLGFTRRIIRRHLYSSFQHENLLFLDLI